MVVKGHENTLDGVQLGFLPACPAAHIVDVIGFDARMRRLHLPQPHHIWHPEHMHCLDKISKVLNAIPNGLSEGDEPDVEAIPAPKFHFPKLTLVQEVLHRAAYYLQEPVQCAANCQRICSSPSEEDGSLKADELATKPMHLLVRLVILVVTYLYSPFGPRMPGSASLMTSSSIAAFDCAQIRILTFGLRWAAAEV